MSAPALRIRGLKKAFPKVVAVAGVDLEVARGEVFGLLGPNGAGKTTTLEIIEGLNLVSMGLFSVGMVNVSYREKGKFRRLAVTPLPKWIFLLGQVLHRLTVTVVQAGVLLLVGRLAFGIQNQGSFLDLTVIMTLGTGCFMAFGFALSGFAETSEGYAAISNLVFFPLMMLSGVYFTLDSAPVWLQHLTAAMPLAPFLKALRAVFNDGGSLAGHGIGLAIVAAWGGAAFLLAVKRFRWA